MTIKLIDIARAINNEHPEITIKDAYQVLRTEQAVIGKCLANGETVGWGNLYTMTPMIKPSHRQNTINGVKTLPAHPQIKLTPRKLIKDIQKKNLE